MDLILGLDRVEHEVTDAGRLGSPQHLLRRREMSAPLLERIRVGRFLEDAARPLDNNASEGALRTVAQPGRSARADCRAAPAGATHLAGRQSSATGNSVPAQGRTASGRRKLTDLVSSRPTRHS